MDVEIIEIDLSILQMFIILVTHKTYLLSAFYEQKGY